MARLVRVRIQSSNATIAAGLDATIRAPGDLAVTCEISRRNTVGDERWRAGQQPDVIVRHVPGGHWASRIRGQVQPVVLFAVDDRVTGADILYALRIQVRGVVSIADDVAGVPRACRLIAAGSAYLSPRLVTVLADHVAGKGAHTTFGLTGREHQVLRCPTAGMPPVEIATDLRIDDRTVRHYLANIYRKLGVRGQTGAVARAYREGLVA